MEQNAKALMRASLDAGTTEDKNVFFSSMVKEYREKLINLHGIAKEEYNKSLHLVDFGLSSRRLYGFEYRNLIEASGQLETHLLKEHLMDDCGQWPELADHLDAPVFFGRHFGEVLSPSPDATTCPGYQQLPTGRSYIAVDARIVQKQLDLNSCPSMPWRLTSTDLVWRAIQHPFQTCRGMSYCSCNPIQELRKGGSLKNTIQSTPCPLWTTLLLYSAANSTYYGNGYKPKCKLLRRLKALQSYPTKH